MKLTKLGKRHLLEQALTGAECMYHIKESTSGGLILRTFTHTDTLQQLIEDLQQTKTWIITLAHIYTENKDLLATVTYRSAQYDHVYKRR